MAASQRAFVIVVGLVAAAAGRAEEPLRYAWRNGQEYAYKFSMTAEVGDESVRSQGGCILSTSPAPAMGRPRGPLTATGTGWVVTADGYLVTCNHVVTGATKIDFALEGKNYPAKVIALDEPHDLAVLKVTAADLTVASIADSDKVELNQDILVVGFPMSDQVGTNIKMSRGIISGIIDDKKVKRSKTLQVDAAINPGNSGGPVFNEMGQAIGVASAKLLGEVVSNIGFVVPSADVVRLLDTKKIKYTRQDGGDPLKATDLARKIKPSVGLLTVTIDPDSLHAERRLVTYRAYAQDSSKVDVGRPVIDQGRFIASVQGEVAEQGGQNILPVGGGKISDFLIDPLPSDGSQTWRVRGLRKVTQVVTQPVAVAPSSPAPQPATPARPAAGRPVGKGPKTTLPQRGFNAFAPRTRWSFRPKRPLRTWPRKKSSTRLPGSGNIVTINKHYTLTTAPRGNEPPYMMIDGKGKLEFDAAAGVTRSMQLDMEMSIADGAHAEKIPLKMGYELVDASSLTFPSASAGSPLAAGPVGAAGSPQPAPRPRRGLPKPRVHGSRCLTPWLCKSRST